MPAPTRGQGLLPALVSPQCRGTIGVSSGVSWVQGWVLVPLGASRSLCPNTGAGSEVGGPCRAVGLEWGQREVPA